MAGIHAREWIAPAAGFYVVDKLIQALSSPEEDRTLNGDVYDIEWIIMPLLNPDGYEYSRTTDRMWRKNRAQSESFWSFMPIINSLIVVSICPKSIRLLDILCRGRP